MYRLTLDKINQILLYQTDLVQSKSSHRFGLILLRTNSLFEVEWHYVYTCLLGDDALSLLPQQITTSTAGQDEIDRLGLSHCMTT